MKLNNKGCFNPNPLAFLLFLPVILLATHPIAALILIYGSAIWIPLSIYLLLRRKK